MDRLRQGVAHARRRADHIGARTQMRHLAQELQGVRLRLDRVGLGVVHPADHLDGARLHLKGLALCRRRHDRPGRRHRATGRQPQNLTGVIGQGVRRHDLQRMKRRPVREVHKRDARSRVPPGAHPAFDRNRHVRRHLARQDRAHAEFSPVHRSRVTQAARPCPAIPTDRGSATGCGGAEAAGGYTPSRITGLVSVPMPVISMSITSPCLTFSGAPSVPIHTTSPG